MQRTVHATEFTYGKITIAEDGTPSVTLHTIVVNESDKKKAYKEAAKKIGNFSPVKTETKEILYTLDDDIFFKYAKVASVNGKPVETAAETTTETATETAAETTTETATETAAETATETSETDNGGN